MPARNLLVFVAATIACLAAWFVRERDRRGLRVNEVFALIDAAYIEPVAAESLVGAALAGAVSTLDENSAYLHGEGQQELEAALDQHFGGVGLELEIDSQTGELSVAMPLVGGPAWQAGIGVGDRIKAIDGETTAGLQLREAVARLRGRPGEPVTLTVASPEADAAAGTITRDVPLLRTLVHIESVLGDRRRQDGSWDWWLEGEPGIAFLRITGFGERTAEEIDVALARVAAGQMCEGGMALPPRGIVIDLRGNPGGLVAAAIEVCDRFLEDGVIVSTRGRRGAALADEAPLESRRATPGAAVVGVPIAVLVDESTASAAEIVAACLQDHRRATVVGSRTYGKGTVQSILPLSGGGLLKLTTAEYIRPSGATIDRRTDDDAWGVMPDAGFAIAPSGAAIDRLTRWRRRRDSGPRTLGSSAALPRPRAIDEVLSRALDALPPASAAGVDLGGEKEAAGDAHDAIPAGA